MALPFGIAVLYVELMDSRREPFVCTPEWHPWRRSNFRIRFWWPAWNGVELDDPGAGEERPPILPTFTFHEGQHTQSTWLTENGILEVARRPRLGQKVKVITRVHDHVPRRWRTRSWTLWSSTRVWTIEWANAGQRRCCRTWSRIRSGIRGSSSRDRIAASPAVLSCRFACNAAWKRTSAPACRSSVIDVRALTACLPCTEEKRIIEMLREAGLTLLSAEEIEATVDFHPPDDRFPVSTFVMLFGESDVPWWHEG